MNLYDAVSEAYETKWSFVNTFYVEFNFSSWLLAKAGWKDFKSEDLALNVISIDTPQISNSPMEILQANKYKIHNSLDEIYRLTVTFRDQDNLFLYKKFRDMYKYQRFQYFDTIKSSLTITKEGDWFNQKDVPVMKINNMLIESVSQMQFSHNTENQIAEFSVGFKATDII